MSRSLLVSRTSLSLSALQLWSPPTYLVVGDVFGPGAQTRRRETVTSPYVTGRTLIGSVPDVQLATLQVQVTGTSGSDLMSSIGDLIEAFSQDSYTLTAAFDGATMAWTCEAADYAVGPQGALDDFDLALHSQVVAFLIYRSPIPVTGAF